MYTTKFVFGCAASMLVLAYCAPPTGGGSESVAHAATPAVSASSTRVPATIGDYGKLSGPMDGYGWVAGCPTCQVSSPSPCNRQEGCYRSTGGKLCIKASIPALSCRKDPAFTCDWDKTWGVVVGFNTHADETPWGVNPASIAVRYESKVGTMTLNAHVKGDPDSVQYCLRHYQSGQPISANQLRTKCWEIGGTTLPSFAQVDKFNLQLNSDYTPVNADYCITEISVAH